MRRADLRRCAAALALSLLAGAPPLVAASTHTGTGPSADASGDQNAVAGPRERPRWIAPLRGEPGRGDDETVGTDVADWRSDARIVVHGEPPAERLVAVIGSMLERLGASRVERRVVETSATTDQVRYFRPEDAAKASSLASVLEPVFGEVRVRDLTAYRPAPPEGSLEVWLR